MRAEQESLQVRIRRQIGRRVVLTFFMLALVVVGFTIDDVNKNFINLKNNLFVLSKSLQNYVIDQVLVENIDAIKARIDDVNQRNNFNLHWYAKKSHCHHSNTLHYVFPLSWYYDYNLLSINQHDFGCFHITGNFASNNNFISSLLYRSIFLILILALGFLLLFPLLKKIPSVLFIDPVLEILRILQKSDNDNDLFLISKKHESVELQEIQMKIYGLIQKTREASKALAISELASQVAHDIRSPLTALTIVLDGVYELEEEKKVMIRSAAQRINDIANNLLNQYQAKTVCHAERVGIHLIVNLIDSIISEKRAINCGNVNIRLEVANHHRFLSAKLEKSQFQRIISNVINNSLEAIDKHGEITIHISDKVGMVEVLISDTGCGIAAEKLAHIFEKQYTANKKSGSGLGLYHAKKYIEKWQGSISAASVIGQGTTISILIPKAPLPFWFCDHLYLPLYATLVVVDDNESIFSVWKQRLKSFLRKKQADIMFFNNITQFEEWYSLNGDKKTYFYLVDYALCNRCNGVELIKKLCIESSSVLVTSQHEDVALQKSCEKNEIRLLPKSLSICIPISLITDQPDLILIDDDDIIRQTWQLFAMKHNLQIMTFANTCAFDWILQHIHYDTPLFIDSSLNQQQSGEQYAKKYFSMGFKTIYLTSGYTKQHFSEMPWIKALVGKKPDFTILEE